MRPMTDQPAPLVLTPEERERIIKSVWWVMAGDDDLHPERERRWHPSWERSNELLDEALAHPLPADPKDWHRD